MDRQRGNCLWLLATTALRLLLLLEALGLRLACISTSDIASPPSHMQKHDDKSSSFPSNHHITSAHCLRIRPWSGIGMA